MKIYFAKQNYNEVGFFTENTSLTYEILIIPLTLSKSESKEAISLILKNFIISTVDASVKDKVPSYFR